VQFFISLLVPLTHPSLRPVSLVANENWYDIDISLQLALLEIVLRRDVMLHVRTVPHASSTYSGSPWPCVRFNTSADNGTLRLACRPHQDTRESFVFLLPHLSHITFYRSHPTEPQCSYDPVEGLPLSADADPIEKIRELEEQVGVSIHNYPCSIVLTFPYSYTFEETEITEGKRISLPFSISKSSSPSL